MSPFVIFVIILVVIWTLSGIATMANKRSEQERRQRLREQMARAAGGLPTRPAVLPQAQREALRRAQPPAAARRIAAGIAQRFPQVLQPPQPALPRRQPAPRRPPPVRVPFAQAKRTPKQQVRQASRPAYAPAPPLPPATPTMPTMPVQPLRSARQAASAAPAARTVRSANAASIARWLNPNTLRGQFILTEVFQPPLAMREERRI